MVAVLLGAMAQAVTGFGYGLVSAPFLVAAYDAPEGVQLNLVMSMAVALLVLASNRRGLDGAVALRLLVPAAVTTVGVGLLVRGSETDGLTVLAGVLCLLAVVLVARGRTSDRLTGTAGTTAVGAVSGAMNVVAGIGGPPVVLFGATAGWTPEVARPTLQVFFLGCNAIALATLGPPDELPPALLGAVVGGILLGRPIARRLRPEHLRVAVLLLAGVGSLLAIARGL